VKEYNGQRSEPTEKHGSVRAAKWQDQKGPNPLMLMGLDRSWRKPRWETIGVFLVL